MSYETEFDNYYRTQWRHDADAGDLLLDHYPYSVAIDLPPGGCWLELGVGAGRVVWRRRDVLSRAAATCIGVDHSQSALETLRRTMPEVPVHLVRADVHALPFARGSFDLVTLFGTLQAVDRDRRMDAVAEMTALLAEGGRLGFSLHPPSLLELVRCMASPRHFRNIVTRRRLRRQLKTHGLDATIEKHYVYVIPKKLLSLVGMTLPHWFGFAEFRRSCLTRLATWVFRHCLSTLAFGHWWVWVTRPGTPPTEIVKD